ncbi:MAG: hypothetical protein QOG13_2795 [Sphingomonadales bacterium]|jgi:hypothetical protein|nr:hypothetical protein [Sphingomonadales bacterium]
MTSGVSILPALAVIYAGIPTPDTHIRSSAAVYNQNSNIILANMQNCQAQSNDYFSAVLENDAQYWVDAYIYVQNSLVGLIVTNGNVCSGYYEVRGTYRYYSRNTERYWSGPVIFQVSNHRVRCIEFPDFPGGCRAPRGGAY